VEDGAGRHVDFRERGVASSSIGHDVIVHFASDDGFI
jgi:hypothetical protein